MCVARVYVRARVPTVALVHVTHASERELARRAPLLTVHGVERSVIMRATFVSCMSSALVSSHWSGHRQQAGCVVELNAFHASLLVTGHNPLEWL